MSQILSILNHHMMKNRIQSVFHITLAWWNDLHGIMDLGIVWVFRSLASYECKHTHIHNSYPYIHTQRKSVFSTLTKINYHNQKKLREESVCLTLQFQSIPEGVTGETQGGSWTYRPQRRATYWLALHGLFIGNLIKAFIIWDSSTPNACSLCQVKTKTKPHLHNIISIIQRY